MFGDMYLTIKEWFKQQTCIHEYGPYREPPCRVDGYSDYQECKKCGRFRWS